MRQAYNARPTLDCTPVLQVELNTSCRDEIIPILRALQHLYGNAGLLKDILALVGKERRVVSALDRNHIAFAWAARGFSCDLWTDPPGQRWKGFSQATNELGIVLEGEMEFEVEGPVQRPAVTE